MFETVCCHRLLSVNTGIRRGRRDWLPVTAAVPRRNKTTNLFSFAVIRRSGVNNSINTSGRREIVDAGPEDRNESEVRREAGTGARFNLPVTPPSVTAGGPPVTTELSLARSVLGFSSRNVFFSGKTTRF